MYILKHTKLKMSQQDDETQIIEHDQFIAFACAMNRTNVLPFDIVSHIGFQMRETIRISFQCYKFFSSLTDDFLNAHIPPYKMETKQKDNIVSVIAYMKADAREMEGWLGELDKLQYDKDHEYNRNYYLMNQTLQIKEI